MKLKVLLADNHPLTLEGIRGALREADDIDIVGEAHDGAEVMPLVRATTPDMALLDIGLPGVDGLACLDLIRRHHPEVKVVIMSASRDRQQIETALERGASAYIVKRVNPLDLASALRQAVEQTVFHAGLGKESTETNGNIGQLTRRELEILTAVARGLSNGAIARELWVTEQTVKFHLTNIYRKLEVSNRTAAVRFAHEHGLVSLVPELATA